jgi:hypothetical protein
VPVIGNSPSSKSACIRFPWPLLRIKVSPPPATLQNCKISNPDVIVAGSDVSVIRICVCSFIACTAIFFFRGECRVLVEGDGSTSPKLDGWCGRYSLSKGDGYLLRLQHEAHILV